MRISVLLYWNKFKTVYKFLVFLSQKIQINFGYQFESHSVLFISDISQKNVPDNIIYITSSLI